MFGHRFDKGSFLEDLTAVIEDAKRFDSSLIVVASEREVRTIEKHFTDDCGINNIRCCTIVDYVTYKWLTMWNERPKHIIIFRYDNIFNMPSAGSRVEYATSVGKRNYKKEENENDIR